jgi:hypothetical protein
MNYDFKSLIFKFLYLLYENVFFINNQNKQHFYYFF